MRFYGKFHNYSCNFEPTVKWGIKDPFGAPAEAFMALELKKGTLEGASGIAEYPDEFLEVCLNKEKIYLKK